MEWMICNQFGCRNLEPFVKAELALKLKPVIAEKAKENNRLSQGQGVKGFQNPEKDIQFNTQKELAKQA